MLMKLAFDKATVRTIDQAGRMHVALTNISKATVNPYRGSEIPNAEQLGLDPDRIYMLLRDPEELRKGADTFNNIPLLSRHVPVTVDDPQHDLVVGSTGTDAIFTAPYLQNSLVIWDAIAIAGVESDEQRELSSAYWYDADMTPGVFQSVPYDGVMRNIRGNHVALVEVGRAGPDVVVADSHTGFDSMNRKDKRAARLLKVALTAHLKPKLAQDSVANLGKDLSALMGAVRAASFKKDKPQLAAAVKAKFQGKLAQDADLDDVIDLLDSLDGDVIDLSKDDDDIEPAISLDSPLAEQIRQLVGDKLDDAGKQALEAILAKIEPDTALDEGGDGNGDPAVPPKPQPAVVDRTAMDAAIRTAKADTVKQMNAIREAEKAVRPFVGDLTVALDSAEEVYKLALDAAQVDLTDVPPSAYAALVRMLPKPGEAPVPPKTRIAQDAADSKAFSERFKHANRLK